jgi:hypothetical protein
MWAGAEKSAGGGPRWRIDPCRLARQVDQFGS